MNDNNVKQNSLKAWFLAARPKTLTAAAVPVMVATALAWKFGTTFSVLAAVLCFLFAFVMQIDANFVNDYFDCVRGNDDETRLGPKRACAQGWISLKAMRIALAVTTLLGCAVGLPLVMFGGYEMVLVGIACVVFCFLYTTCLSYWGLGDLLVLVFFGLVPVCCTYYVETGLLPDRYVYVMAVCVGLVTDTLLIVNNYRDIDNDRRAGKRTLAVFLGRNATSWMYLAIVPVALILMSVCFWWAAYCVMYLAAIVMMFFHITTWLEMKKIGQGRELNRVLGMTARNIFVYGLLSTVAIIFA